MPLTITSPGEKRANFSAFRTFFFFFFFFCACLVLTVFFSFWCLGRAAACDWAPGVSLTLCCFVVYSTRRFVLSLALCYFVLVFFSPFSDYLNKTDTPIFYL